MAVWRELFELSASQVWPGLDVVIFEKHAPSGEPRVEVDRVDEVVFSRVGVEVGYGSDGSREREYDGAIVPFAPDGAKFSTEEVIEPMSYFCFEVAHELRNVVWVIDGEQEVSVGGFENEVAYEYRV